MRYTNLRAIGLSVLVTIIHPTIGTAQATPPPTNQTSNSDTQTDLQEIVVTAQRREQRLIDVPLSVQAISGAQLTVAGVTDAPSITQIAPAVSFDQSFSTTSSSFSMRGALSLVDDASVQPSVGVVIDGVPVARQAEVVLDLVDIDRIEVLSGPQGTLFGKNATGGVINIISKRPTNTFEGSTEADLTNDGEIITKGVVNVPFSDNIDGRLNFFYDDYPPLIKNIGGPNQFDLRTFGTEGKLLFNLNDSTSLLLSVAYRNFNGGASPGLIIVPNSGALGALQRQILGPAIGWGVNEINQNSPEKNEGNSWSYVAELDSKLSDRLSLVAISGFRRYRILFGPDTDDGPTGVDYGVGYAPNPLNYPIGYIDPPVPSLFDYRYFSQEVRLSYSAPGVDIIGGLFYQTYHEEEFKQTAGFVFDGTYLGLTTVPGTLFYVDNYINETIRDNTYAAFGDATVEIVPTVKLFGGLRYTSEMVGFDYSRTNFFNPTEGFFNPVTEVNTAPPVGVVAFNNDHRSDSDITGRAGVQWQPQPDMNFYASFNTGFKGAAANGSQTLTGPTGALVAPEKAHAVEIGTKQRYLEGALGFEASIYSQTIDNIQQTAVLPGTVDATLVNAGALKTNGFEVSVNGRPTRELELNAAVVLNNAKYSGNYFFACGPSATPGVGSCLPNGTLSLNGTRAIGAPEWKFVTSAVHQHMLTDTLKLTTRVAYDWRSEVQYQLQHDPLTEQPSFGLLDASIGIGAPNDRWQVSLFAKNLTDKFHYSWLYTANGVIGQSFGYLPRDYARYGGVRLNYNF